MPNIGNAAKQLLTRPQETSTEFNLNKLIILSLVDMIDSEEALAAEQAILDKHLDSVEDLATCIQNLIDSANKPKRVHEHTVITKRLGRLQKCLKTVDEALKALVGCETDAPSLKLHNEQLQDYNRELADINVKTLLVGLRRH